MALHSLDDLRGLAVKALTASKTSPENAAFVADALIKADADGIPSHGVARVPAYADQASTGKVDGFAVPEITETGASALRVDAKCGFAYPAIAQGLDRAAAMAASTGVAAAAIGNSHHAGVGGHHVESMAERGLAAMMFLNSPAAITPWGGNRSLYGINVMAFACPRPEGPPLVIDSSFSKVARGKVKLAADRGEPIPEGWATDSDGNPTTDAKAAMSGFFLPIGDAKGAALMMMVEIMSAAMTGSNFSYEASSFYDADGPPPRTGQFFLVFKPESLGGGGAVGRIEELAAAVLDQPGTRLPGDRRLENRKKARESGVEIPDSLFDELTARAGG